MKMGNEEGINFGAARIVGRREEKWGT